MALMNGLLIIVVVVLAESECLSKISGKINRENYLRVKRRNFEFLNYLADQGDDFWKNEIFTDHVVLSKFSWMNCGTSKDPLQLQKLTLSPDPIKLPGNINVSFVADLAETLVDSLKAEVEVEKKIFIWIKIPCVDNIGSCTYEDVCQMVSSCPESFIKSDIPCHCPFKQASYQLPPSAIYIDPSQFPSSLLNGDYKITVKLSHQGEQVGCYQVLLSLSH